MIENKNNHFDNFHGNPRMQNEKQRQSSLIAMQKYGFFAPNFQSELADKKKLRKRKRM